MLDPKCPDCNNTNDFTVIGLEDGRIRLRCENCLHDHLAENGPSLVPCHLIVCSNWVEVGVGYCTSHRSPLERPPYVAVS